MGSGRRVETVGALFVVLAALCFGCTVIFGKLLANRDLPVPSMLAIRFGTAALVLAILSVLTRRRLAPAAGETWRVLGLGAIGYAAESALFFLALKHGSVAAVTLLFFTYPVWVAALSAVLGLGVPGLLLSGALAAAVAGAALVVGSSGGLIVTTAGVLFALASALTFSVYLIGADAGLRRTPPLASAMWVAASASAALALAAVLNPGARLPADGREWGTVLAMGVLTAAAFSFLFSGLRRLGAVRSSVIAALEPLAAATLAAIFLGERIVPGTLTGGALILAGAITATFARRRRPEPEIP